MSSANMTMRYFKTDNIIPNYEARVLSTIMFVIKLIFRLDDKTEYEFSKQAATFNTGKPEKLFIWKEWMDFIDYRKLALTRHHFPTAKLYDEENVHTAKLFARFSEHQRFAMASTTKLSRQSEVLEIMLNRLKNLQSSECDELILVLPSLLPFATATEVLLNSKKVSDENLYNTLSADFRNSSINYVVNPFCCSNILENYTEISVAFAGSNCLNIVPVTNRNKEEANLRKKDKRKVSN